MSADKAGRTSASLPVPVPGPRGCHLVVDRASDIPLVWFTIAVPGGSAGDPDGCEGFTNHMATLARRGAGTRDRQDLDRELDQLGASLDVVVDRDSIRLSGMCLRRNLDPVIELTADILARPRMAGEEHDKLLRETRLFLDELRDEDDQMAARFFNRHCVPGYPYSHSIAGTESSLDRIEARGVDEIRRAYRRSVVPGNLLIGFAGDIAGSGGCSAEDSAAALAARLVGELPGSSDQDPPTLPTLDPPEIPRGRRLVVVDKPERTQSQILVGHLGPRHGTRDALVLGVAEAAFGGMFTSRLMQEIRVARGWSYGAGCTLHHGRGPHWFSIHLAPSAEVTPDALRLVLDMLGDLAKNGITADELAFTRSYLLGNLPFRLATARQRMRLALMGRLFGLPADHTQRLPEELEAITLDEVNQACRTWLRPDDTLSVVVATADTMVPALEGIGAGTPEVVAHDSY